MSAAAISVAISSAKKSLPTQYAAWDAAPKESLSKSLVIRIATDDLAATAAPWSFESAAAPYFTEDAIDFLNNQQVTHLLVEFPSVDRLADGGQLINHHKFWNINRETRDLTQACPSKTITEMIEVSPTMKDGLYLLSFHVPPVRTDAMLSNPVLFKLCHQA